MLDIPVCKHVKLIHEHHVAKSGWLATEASLGCSIRRLMQSVIPCPRQLAALSVQASKQCIFIGALHAHVENPSASNEIIKYSETSLEIELQAMLYTSEDQRRVPQVKLLL